MPSRYCLPDMLGNEAWSRFSALPPGYTRVQAICQHVNDHLQFAYGSSSPTSTAVDVNASGFGVCRDFTHLAITFCRAMNIPARYVFGYLPDMDVPIDPNPMDFAAWMEVWLGDRWWTFDPRNNVRRKGRILIGRGRDASDVAMVTSFGGPMLQSMSVVAEEVIDSGIAGRQEENVMAPTLSTPRLLLRGMAGRRRARRAGDLRSARRRPLAESGDGSDLRRGCDAGAVAALDRRGSTGRFRRPAGGR